MLIGPLSAILFISLAGVAAPSISDDPATAQADLTEHATAEDRVQSFLDAFETGDADAYARWHRVHRTSDGANDGTDAQRLTDFKQFMRDWHEITPVALLRPAPNLIEARAEADDGRIVTFLFRFEADAPFAVESVDIQIARAREKFQVSSTWANLDELAEAAKTHSGVPAIAIGVYSDGQFYTGIAGVRSVEASQDAQIQDSFHWGSIGKSVTGTMIAKLIEDGVLDWESRIADFFPNGSYHPDYANVRLWQLMSHQGGVPAMTQFDDALEQRLSHLEGSTTEKRAQFIQQMLSSPPEYAPGTRALYSNGSVTVAGRIAELATGRNWEALVQDLVFSPLAMENTSVISGQRTRVEGHFQSSDGKFEVARIPSDFIAPQMVAPAGGTEGSIGDLLRLGVAHLDGLEGKDGLLTSSTIKKLHSPHVGQLPLGAEDYNFGWGTICPMEIAEDLTCIGHNGGNGMFFAELLIIPQKDIVIAFLANNTDAAVPLVREIFPAILERYSETKPSN